MPEIDLHSIKKYKEKSFGHAHLTGNDGCQVVTLSWADWEDIRRRVCFASDTVISLRVAVRVTDASIKK